MSFYADLHIHSKYSRATSGDLDFFHIALWAKKKGVTVVGTGDFTHPAWMVAIKEELVPAEPGLFRLRDDLEAAVGAELGPCLVAAAPVRFLLEVEISTIYKQGDKVRKVHHLLYAPDIAGAERISAALARIGNLAADGRPILGLNSRDLLEICLLAGEGCYLIPAPIWTPWFSVFGSKSGFDALKECYGDLTGQIFALETGLSSDPPMNWRVSALDTYRLVSNSDAHSPGNLGREACRFDCALDFFAMKRALETGRGYGGSVEFFPEEGKYHLDGHRACGFRCEPEESRRLGGRCRVCGQSLTLGVHYRVLELADRAEARAPPGAAPFRSLVPLPEMLGELHRTGSKSKSVQRSYEQLIAGLGPELFLLVDAPLDEIGRVASPFMVEAVRRLRAGEVIREGGYDGEYGVIRLFKPDELESAKSVSLLFDLPAAAAPRSVKAGRVKKSDGALRQEEPMRPLVIGAADLAISIPREDASGSRVLAGLDFEQRAAAGITQGALLIIAGPGTGKTRTLTHRLAHLVAEMGASPEACLAVTFTRRAAGEMQERLRRLLPDGPGARVPVMTFHALGLAILREQEAGLGLGAPLRVVDEGEAFALAREILDLSPTETRRMMIDGADGSRFSEFRAALHARGLVDFTDLVRLPAELLGSRPDLAAMYRARWPHVSVDEYQDMDAWQYQLVRLLAPTVPDPGLAAEHRSSLCVIGDPDQAIYGFRGANVRFFQQFQTDYPSARMVHLTQNYRSTRAIVDAAVQAIAPSTLVRGRALTAQNSGPTRIIVRECATERAEAEFVVATIEKLVGGTSLASFDTGRVTPEDAWGFTFDDFAVLYRTNAQATTLVEAFARSGIPFQKRAHTPLAEHPTAQVVLERLRILPEGLPLADRFETVVTELARAAQPDADLPRLTLALRPLAEKSGASLEAFTSELALGVDVDLWDPRAERVSLLTLHAAKGLEFRVVFLAGCEDGLLPFRFGPNESVDEAEERRLFFVGLTRARDTLLLTHARRRHWQGELRERRRSPFLAAIHERLLDRQREEAPATPRVRQMELF